jgi:large conductance mechanosensitive channel
VLSVLPLSMSNIGIVNLEVETRFPFIMDNRKPEIHIEIPSDGADLKGDVQISKTSSLLPKAKSSSIRSGSSRSSRRRYKYVRRFPSKLKSRAIKLGQNSKTVFTKVFKDFKSFIDRGNVIDLAVGLVLGSAFTSIVNSLVNDIFTPVIGLAVDSSLENAHFVVACPRLSNNSRDRGIVGVHCVQNQWPTVASAKTAGAIVFSYGAFIQNVINFMIISSIVYFIVKLYTVAFHIKKPKKTIPCKFCLKDVPTKAVKCCWCASELEPQPSPLKSAKSAVLPAKP